MRERGFDDAREPDPAALLSPRTAALVWLIIPASAVASLAVFYLHGLSNLYGDGIAHVEGARRLWDSLTPGYAEIGSVWLPLFHILASPLALNDFLWRTGLAGSLVSSVSFILSAWFLFRLSLEMNRSLAAATVTLATFLLCPNMAYLASTPLTEPLALLWLVLTVYGLFRFQQAGRTRALLGSAVAAFFGTLTRYDAWYLLPFAALFVLFARPGPWGTRFRRAALFSTLAGLGPVLWLAHNAYRFGNALEFYNGPFSANAIYAHQLATTAFPYPTDGSLLRSARYYLEDLKLVIGPWPLELAMLGLIAWAVDARERRGRSAALLFLVVLPFYLHSLAFAAVPIYVPTLFPHAYYNLRYGLEMLPAVAVLSSFVFAPRLPHRVRAVLAVVLFGVLAGQAASMLSGGIQELPVVEEGVLNTPCRSKRQQAVIRFLRTRYDGGMVLMAAGKWPCVMPQVGIPFRKTVTEANREYRSQLRSEPQRWVAWIVRGDGDAVDDLMRAYPAAFKDFELLDRESFADEAGVAIYRRRAP